jgi:hypothetical protein
MLALLVAAAAVPAPATGALDAEYAFIRAAEQQGQWTAFRRFAHPDAVMFTPETVWAQQWLKGRADPPRTIEWRPAISFVSCDGRTAVNQGPWLSASGKASGTFTTVWRADGRTWRWVYDGGKAAVGPVSWPAKAEVKQAACARKLPGPPVASPPPAVRHRNGSPPDDFGRGVSADKTLGWDWKLSEPGKVRHFRVFLWNGRSYDLAIDQTVAAE